MKAIYKAVNEEPKVVDIENTLEALQKAVGGYIEVVGVGDDVLMVLDEEGKLKGKAANFATEYDVIVGNVLFVQHDGHGDFTDLSAENIVTVLESFE